MGRQVSRVDCHGKVAFPSWTLAEKAAKRTRKDNRHPYHCRACHFVHLGTSIAPQSAMRREAA